MTDPKITKLKRLAARLDYPQIVIFHSWLTKKRDEKARQHRDNQIKEREKGITSLPEGTQVIYNDTRSQLAGRIGKIVRHFTYRGHSRTVVDFDGAYWKVNSRNLSTDTSETNKNRIKVARRTAEALNKVVSTLTKPRRRKPSCYACGYEIPKGRGKIFKSSNPWYRNMLMHKLKKECYDKKRWAHLRKDLKKTKEDFRSS